jgi:hypothetical protein
MATPKKEGEMQVSSVRTERRCSRQWLCWNLPRSGRHLTAAWEPSMWKRSLRPQHRHWKLLLLPPMMQLRARPVAEGAVGVVAEEVEGRPLPPLLAKRVRLPQRQ